MVALNRKPWYLGAAKGDAPIEYVARELRMLPDALVTAVGVCGPDDFRVVPRQAGATISDVEVWATGANAILPGTAGQGKVVQPSDGNLAVSGFAAPSSGTRYYLIYLQWHNKQASQGADYQSVIDFAFGSSLPNIANIPNAIPLAQVTIAAGQSSIQAQHIWDLRPQAMGLPSLNAYVEFYGGTGQHLDRRVAALYQPGGVRFNRGFSVGPGGNIPDPTRCSTYVPYSGLWDVEVSLSANCPAFDGDRLTLGTGAIVRTSLLLGNRKRYLPGGQNATTVSGPKYIQVAGQLGMPCYRGDRLDVYFEYEGAYETSNLNDADGNLGVSIRYAGPLPGLS